MNKTQISESTLEFDLEAYINSYNAFNTVEAPEKQLISSLLNAPAEYYNNDANLLLKMVGAIKKWDIQKNFEYDLKTFVLKAMTSAYNDNEKCLKCREFDASLDEIKIPRAYFLIGLLFLVAFCVFSTLLCVQLLCEIFIISIHYLLMFIVASGGMLATVVAAVIDWKKLKEGKRNR